MNRREAIERAALVLGYAVTGPALVGVLNGCSPKPDLNYKPVFFSEDQARVISELTEIILPKTTTPGAKDVGVPGFIDSLLKEVYSPQDQESFLKGLSEFEEKAKKELGDDFSEAKPEEQKAFVKKHHDEELSNAKGLGSWGWWSSDTEEKPFIFIVKELTLLGFFTSQVGATEVLQYNQVPGPFQGCVPLEKVGKAWAT